jgi:hypothetical protein
LIVPAKCGVGNGGEGGIRTRGTLLRFTSLAKKRFRPLSHFSLPEPHRKHLRGRISIEFFYKMLCRKLPFV